MGHHLVTFLIFLNTPHPPKLHETSAHRDSARLIHTLWPWAVASARSIGEAQWYGRRRGARHPALEAPREAMVVVFSTKESGEFWRKTQGFLKNRFGKMEMMQRLVRKQGFYTQTQGFNSGAFWSIDVYKCHKLRDMNVCVCVLFIYDIFFYIYIQQLFMCVCVFQLSFHIQQFLERAEDRNRGSPSDCRGGLSGGFWSIFIDLHGLITYTPW